MRCSRFGPEGGFDPDIAETASLGFPPSMPRTTPAPGLPNPPTPRALHELLEKQAITELVHAYSRAVDRQDFALLEDLYTEDGIDDHGGLYCGPAAGFVAWLKEALDGVDLTSHQVHNLTIALDGDHAEGELYLTAFNRLRGEDGALQEFVQGLRYLDRYRKGIDGRWRFAHRTVVVDWARLSPALWDLDHPLLTGKRVGRPDDADPSYRALSSVAFARGARGEATVETETETEGAAPEGDAQ